MFWEGVFFPFFVRKSHGLWLPIYYESVVVTYHPWNAEFLKEFIIVRKTYQPVISLRIADAIWFEKLTSQNYQIKFVLIIHCNFILNRLDRLTLKIFGENFIFSHFIFWNFVKGYYSYSLRSGKVTNLVFINDFTYRGIKTFSRGHYFIG